MNQDCVFCDIVAGVEPASVRYEDGEVIVFDNVLGWTQLMLLAVPKQHKSQTELWQHLGHVGKIASEQGRKYAPEGFRILSNFGGFGMQSQPHGHLHILDGTDASLQVKRDPPVSTGDVVVEQGTELLRTAAAIYFDASEFVSADLPVNALAVPPDDRPTQEDFWRDIHELGEDATAVGWSSSPNGFRLLANFPSLNSSGYQERGHVQIMGGTFLGHYA